MAKEPVTFEISTTGPNVQKHQADSIRTDEVGSLILEADAAIVAIYASGQWKKVIKSGTQLR
jgi:hypothetical protein